MGNLSSFSASLKSNQELLRSVIKTLEFICITADGLDLLYANSGITVEVIDLCFKSNTRAEVMDVDQGSSLVIQDMETLYPAATILLDLTANEEKVDEICSFCREKGMFSYIIQDKLQQLLSQSDRLHSTQLKKLRDLFIGMTLNLACNVECTTIIVELIKSHGILGMLLEILQDER